VASQVCSQVSLSPTGGSRRSAGRRRAQRCGFDGSGRLLAARASSLTSRRSPVRARHRPLPLKRLREPKSGRKAPRERRLAVSLIVCGGVWWDFSVSAAPIPRVSPASVLSRPCRRSSPGGSAGSKARLRERTKRPRPTVLKGKRVAAAAAVGAIPPSSKTGCDSLEQAASAPRSSR